MSERLGIPWFYVVLDVIGAFFIVAGVMGIIGMQFGHPVLRQVAPGFLLLGILLMVPLVVGLIRRLKAA